MIKLGSHNSLTYVKPQWYMRMFSWIGKCQSKTIKEQYELGVRYFDIRVKYNGNGDPISGHGLLTYNINILDVLTEINTFGDCIVRIILENDKNNGVELFKLDVQLWNKIFSKTTFVGGAIKGTWEVLVSLSKWVSVEENYWQFNKNGKWFPYPEKYAKDFNDKYITEYNLKFLNVPEIKKPPLMLDFIEYK